jgi:hypothetical protein
MQVGNSVGQVDIPKMPGELMICVKGLCDAAVGPGELAIRVFLLHGWLPTAWTLTARATDAEAACQVFPCSPVVAFALRDSSALVRRPVYS